MHFINLADIKATYKWETPQAICDKLKSIIKIWTAKFFYTTMI